MFSGDSIFFLNLKHVHVYTKLEIVDQTDVKQIKVNTFLKLYIIIQKLTWKLRQLNEHFFSFHNIWNTKTLKLYN